MNNLFTGPKQRSPSQPHLVSVPDETIPTHRLSGSTRVPTRVEHILPAEGPVNNGVHRHDFHELFFFAMGGGQHMIDLENFPVQAPSMHLVAPGQVHHLHRSADMQGVVVMFGTDAHLGQGHAARAELFAHAQRPSEVLLDQARMDEAMTLVHSMEVELARPEGPLAEVVEGYLGILLIKCAHWANDVLGKAPERSEGNDPVRRFQHLVEHSFLEQRQVAHYAETLAMSPDHLNELVKERLGTTASGLIHDRLFLEAKRLLLYADQSVKEVGYALNMKDPAYFTRWFNKAAGMSPVAYREHIREKYKR
jgi:AraC-like DNA-binding protein/mannose-6-phosphate isomerase-like protein (cupin superfamily)